MKLRYCFRAEATKLRNQDRTGKRGKKHTNNNCQLGNEQEFCFVSFFPSFCFPSLLRSIFHPCIITVSGNGANADCGLVASSIVTVTQLLLVKAAA